MPRKQHRSFEFAYGPDPLQTLDFYQCQGPSDVLLIFIHGGVWRSGDKEEHQTLFRRLSCVGNVASLNYRLSIPASAPAVQHPSHEEDLDKAVKWLLGSDAPGRNRAPGSAEAPKQQVVLVGHSAGVHLSLRLLTRSPLIRQHINAFVGLAGIYDLESLVDEYPDYLNFTEQAFSSNRTLWPSTKDAVLLLRDVHVHIIHSKNDGLLSLRQPGVFKSWLDQAHSKVRPASVVEDYDKVTEQHDEMLDSTALANAMIDFLMHLEKS